MNSNIHIMLMNQSLYPVAELEQTILPQLHADEQVRYRAFKHPPRRHSWLAGRALLLAALQRELSRIDPAALRTRSEGGVCYDAADIHLNLSHSGDLLAVVLSSCRVGIDIERPRPRKLIDNIGEYFAKHEAAMLQALPEDQRQRMFYMLWTLKEAACKSVGLSMWQTLRNTAFDVQACSAACYPPFPEGSWRFISARVDPDWCLAVAAYGVDAAIDAGCWRLVAPGQWQAEQLAECVWLRGESLPAATHGANDNAQYSRT